MLDKKYIKIIEAENSCLKDEIDRLLEKIEKQDMVIKELMEKDNSLSDQDFYIADIKKMMARKNTNLPNSKDDKKEKK